MPSRSCVRTGLTLLCAVAILSPLAARDPVEIGTGAGVEIPKVRLSLKALDLTRNPSDEELMAAGQLGGQLYPTHSIAKAKRSGRINRSFGYAIQAWNDHDYPHAVRLFREHLAKYPDSPWAAEAKLHLGCDARYNGRYREAEGHYEWIIERNPENDHYGKRMMRNKARQRMGVLKVLQNNFGAAAEQFTMLKQDSPDWRQRTYASHWIQRLSRYKSNELEMLNCGTEALAHVLRRDGKQAAARLVVEILPDTTMGHSLDDLAGLASRHGYELVGLRLKPRQIDSVPLPAIIQLQGSPQAGDRGHYWVLEDVSRRSVSLYDPQSRRRFVQSTDEFAAEWDGNALVFSLGEDLPGVRLASSEMSEIHGGCCGAPRPEDDLGEPDGGTEDDCGAPAWAVNMSSMNLFMTDTPMWYRPPIGPSVELKLSYNSQSSIAYNEPFGNKWQFNYGSYLVADTVGTVIVFMPDGRRDEYVYDNAGTWEPPYQVHNELNRVSDDRYELRLPDGTTYAYDMPQVISIWHPCTRCPPITITQHFLAEIRDAHGQRLRFDYDVDGQLTTVTDAIGRQTVLTYNTSGHVTQASDPFGRTAMFEYDGLDNLTAITDMGGYRSDLTYDADVYLTSVSNPRGQWDFLIEPADGIVANSDAYPPPGDAMWENYRITVTDPLGGTEEYFYYGGCDPNWGNICSGYSWYVSPRDYVPWESPEINNYVSGTPKTRYFFTTLQGAETELSRIATPEGTEWTFVHDGAGNLTTTTDPHGHQTDFTHNSKGRVTSITNPKGTVTTLQYAPNEIDVTEIRDALGAETFTYNDAHDVLSVTDRSMSTISLGYNGFGQLTTIDDPLGNTVSLSYDAGHRVTQATSGGQTLFSRTYDPVGRIATHTDATGLQLSLSYDDLDQVTRLTYPDGRFVSRTYSSCCPHLLDLETDRAGRTTTYKYDELQRLIEVRNPETGLSRFAYDRNGNLVRRTDPLGNATTFEYDLDDRVVTRTYANGDQETSSYDAAGLIARYTNARGITADHVYDDTHNLTGIDYSDGTPDVSFQYDTFDRLTQRSGGIGTHAYTYDAASRVETIDGPWTSDTVSLAYDALGRMASVSVEGGQSISYHYDAFSRLETVQSATDTFLYSYVGASPVVQGLARPSGSTTSYQYDLLNRLTHVTNKDSLAQTINSYVYGYDTKDLRDSETTTGDPAATPLADDLVTYDYDAANQLVAFDNPANALTYDQDGNLTHGVTPDGYPFIASYDAENRLSMLEYSDGGGVVQRTDYEYSSDGTLARTLKREDGVVTDDRRFIRAGLLLLQERDGSNVVTSDNTWGLHFGGGIGGLLRAGPTGTDHEYLFDGKGNVTAVLDGTQTPVASYSYDPFGAPRARSGALEQEFRFATKMYDEQTGLSYFGFRFYSPLIGRWISRDPSRESGGANLYAYAENDPVSFVDPTGLRRRRVSPGAVQFPGTVSWSSPQGTISVALEDVAVRPADPALVPIPLPPRKPAGGGGECSEPDEVFEVTVTNYETGEEITFTIEVTHIGEDFPAPTAMDNFVADTESAIGSLIDAFQAGWNLTFGN